MSTAEPAKSPEVLEPVLDGYGWRRWSLPAVASSVPFLRGLLRGVLDDTRLSREQVDDLLLAVGEAVSNAIEHAQEPTRPVIDMTVEAADSRVTIVVRDYGCWRHAPSGPHRGRGLALLRALADATVTSASSGTTVTIHGPVPSG